MFYKLYDLPTVIERVSSDHLTLQNLNPCVLLITLEEVPFGKRKEQRLSMKRDVARILWEEPKACRLGLSCGV